MLLFCFTGCVDSQDVTINGIKNYELRLPTSAKLSVGIENRSAHKLRLIAFNLSVESGGRKVLGVTIPEPVTVPARFSGEVPLDLRLTLTDPLLGLSAAGNLRSGKTAGLTVSGEIVARAGWARKKIRVENEPISQILSKFGVSL